MRARISYVTVKRSGTRAVREMTIDVEVLRLGRGTDNQVQLVGLSVALEYASIHLRQGQPWIETVRGDDLRVNGRVVSAHVLRPGDIIRIGPHELRVQARPLDIDLALEVEQIEMSEAAAASLASRTRLGIHRGMLTRRRLGWLMGVTSAVVFFAVPFWLEKNATPFNPKDPGEGRAGGARLLASSWSSGPLSDSHAHFGDRCNACHATGFEVVADDACLGCHASIGAHTTEHGAGQFKDTRCAECHHEHRGGQTLATFRDSLCADCHADIQKTHDGSDLLDVTDFAIGHPEFRPAVLIQPGSKTQKRFSLKDAPKEQSGLRFPHDKHLAGPLKTAEGQVTLECKSCHEMDARGETMKTIDFEKNCRSCHTLTFDQHYPDRHALHGDPAIIESDLFEFYATRALQGEERNEDAPAVARRRPGREMTPEEKAGVIRWVGEKTARVRRLLLADEGACATCHVLDRSGAEVVVVPALLVPFFPGAQRWMGKALFAHEAHMSLPCESCHAAKTSSSATDVLLPGIESCRECHGGGAAQLGKLTSPCTSCHDFHRDRMGVMRASEPAQAQAEAGS